MYVSAQFMAVVGLDGKVITDKQVAATDDQGKVWQLPADSDQGDWVQYLADGGTIEPFTTGSLPVDNRITSSPDRLFGGPTLKEVFRG